MALLTTPAAIAALLRETRTIAVIGASPNPSRASHHVFAYLRDAGFTVYPVNPTVAEVLGETSCPSLSALRGASIAIDLVDCFRRSEEMPALVEEAIACGAGAIWMQEGVVHTAAAARASASGLKVVMDRCIMVDHRNLVARA